MLFLTIDNIKYIKECFIEELDGYNILRKDIGNENEIIIIEDSLIILIGVYVSPSTVPLNYKDIYKDRSENTFLKIPKFNTDYYELNIMELTYNTINFKHNHKKFIEKIKKDKNIHDFLNLDVAYTHFKGFARPYWCPDEESIPEKVNRLYPELHLKERYDLWEGIKYYIIIMSIKDVNDKEEFAVSWTTQKPHSYILTLAKDWIKYGFTHNMMYVRQDSQKFIYAFESYKNTGVSRQKRIEEKFKYYYFERNYKEKSDIWKYADEFLEKAYNQDYRNEEYSTFIRPVNKWKSEELVYELTKKICKGYEVIYQHRPYFLRSNIGGQMSYDVYIPKLHIAIEYQGKQHFEPIDFFGGNDSYIRGVKRDKLKKELSEQNGIKLIYINYWDEITEKLIKEKINNCL